MRGRALTESAHIRYAYGGRDTRYGTDEMVELLEAAAAHVAAVLPGAKLSVGSISSARGGRLRPHRSHRVGRDVDLSFYWLDAAGAPVYPRHFVRCGADGRGREQGGREYVFDDARNWELVSFLLLNDIAPAQYLFVSNAVRARLVAEALRRGGSAEAIARVERVVEQPRRGSPHRDHYHLRVYCAPSDRPSCLDVAPLHPWAPAGAVLSPSPRRSRARAPSRSSTRARSVAAARR